MSDPVMYDDDGAALGIDWMAVVADIAARPEVKDEP